jgi:hypothetical protein
VRGLRAQAASENFMTLGGALAAKMRLIVWCKACGHQVEPDLAAQVPALTDTRSFLFRPNRADRRRSADCRRSSRLMERLAGARAYIVFEAAGVFLNESTGRFDQGGYGRDKAAELVARARVSIGA